MHERSFAAFLAAAVLAGCGGGTEDAASESDMATATSATTAATSSSDRSDTSEPSPISEGPSTFGVVETTRVPIEPGAETCPSPTRAPGTQTVSFVQGSRPGTPIVKIAVPETWTTAVSQDDPTMTLTGPDGLAGTLTVAPTELDPAGAFGAYADDAMDAAEISSQSVLPADLCGYSGQKIMGTSSGSDRDPVQYTDRLAHVWTNAATYLVAIHVQGPQGAPGFPAAEELIVGDFGIRLP